MDKKIPWHEPRFGKEEKRLVSEVLDSRFVSEGEKSQMLVGCLKEYLRVNYIVLTVSGTASIFLALKADKLIRALDYFEVIVPDLAPVAVANAVRWAGGEPILADVNIESLCLDLESAKSKTTPHTKAIILVHTLGRNALNGDFKEFASENGLTLIEDSAGALGSKHNGQFLGTFGKMGCFSLQAQKIISAGQGGFIATEDSTYFRMLSRLKDQGKIIDERDYPIEGYNLEFNDVSAAIGLAQIRGIEKRKHLLINQWRQYHRALGDLPQVEFPKVQINSGEVPLYINAFFERRDELMQRLSMKNIGWMDFWPLTHRKPFYSKQGGDERFPNACYIADNALWLPNGPTVTSDDIKSVCKTLHDFYLEERGEGGI